MRDVERADDADAEPDEEDEPGEQEVPASVVLLCDRAHGGLGRGGADPEVACRILSRDAIRVDPEAQH